MIELRLSQFNPGGLELSYIQDLQGYFKYIITHRYGTITRQPSQTFIPKITNSMEKEGVTIA